VNFFGPVRPDNRSPRRNQYERSHSQRNRPTSHNHQQNHRRPGLFDFGPPRYRQEEVKPKAKKSFDLNKINGGLQKIQIGLQLLSAFKSKQ
jgi:hypothetical protein